MNEHLTQLVKLSQFDKDIVGFEPQIENEQEKLNAFTKVVDEINGEVEKLYQLIDETKNKRIKNDLHLKELSDKLAEIDGKHKLAKTEKEVKALQLEEEIAKEQITFANEEIERLDEIAAAKEEELKELQAKLAEEEDSIKEIQVAVDNAIDEINQERNAVYQERSELLEKFDNKILTFYEKIRRWAKDSAVVPVVDQACYGCFMKINDKTYSEVIKSEEIINCPHCGRILYKENETEEA